MNTKNDKSTGDIEISFLDSCLHVPQHEWGKFVENTRVWRDFIGLSRALGLPELGDTIPKKGLELSAFTTLTNYLTDWVTIATHTDLEVRKYKPGYGDSQTNTELEFPKLKSTFSQWMVSRSEAPSVFHFSGKSIEKYDIQDIPKLIEWTQNHINRELGHVLANDEIEDEHRIETAKNYSVLLAILSNAMNAIKQNIQVIDFAHPENLTLAKRKEANLILKRSGIAICAIAYLTTNAIQRIAVAIVAVLFSTLCNAFLGLQKKYEQGYNQHRLFKSTEQPGEQKVEQTEIYVAGSGSENEDTGSELDDMSPDSTPEHSPKNTPRT